jgi:hypothetical protein
MTLLRLVQRASIISSMFLASLLLYSSPARSEQRVCIITDDGATMCGKPTSLKKEAKNPNKSSGYRKEISSFIFLLKGCEKSDTTIKCNMSIMNKGAERFLSMTSYDVKIVDSVGKSHKSSRTSIGDENAYYLVKIIPGIDYAATITFEGVPEQITQSQVLDIGTSVGHLLFRNVSFSN